MAVGRLIRPIGPRPRAGRGDEKEGHTRERSSLEGGRSMLSRLLGMGLVSCGLLFVSPTVRGDDAAVEKDLKKLEGEWTVKSEGGSEISYKFKGDKLEVTAPSRSYKMTV